MQMVTYGLHWTTQAIRDALPQDQLLMWRLKSEDAWPPNSPSCAKAWLDVLRVSPHSKHPKWGCSHSVQQHWLQAIPWCMWVCGFNSGPSCYSSTDFFFCCCWFSFSLNREKWSKIRKQSLFESEWRALSPPPPCFFPTLTSQWFFFLLAAVSGIGDNCQ